MSAHVSAGRVFRWPPNSLLPPTEPASPISDAELGSGYALLGFLARGTIYQLALKQGAIAQALRTAADVSQRRSQGSDQMIAAVILRTAALEDRTLQRELPGYQAYRQQVRYRLLPRV